MATLLLFGPFIASKQGKTGLTVTLDLHRIAIADASTSEIVTGGACAEVGDGVYVYRYAAADLATYAYIGVMKTADATVDQQHVPVQGIVIPDELTSTRLATSGYTTPPTVSAIADQVWDEVMGHTTASTAGALLASAGSAADPLLNTVPGTYAAGTAGAALGRVGTAAVTFTAPMTSDGTGIHLVRGDDYLNTDSRALTFTGTTWPTLTGGTVKLKVQWRGNSIGTYSGTVTGAQACRVELTDIETADLIPAVYAYDLEAVLLNGSVVTLVQGMLSVGPDVR